MTTKPADGELPTTFDRSVYVPMHLVGLANRLSRGLSKLYLRLFGVGVIEWRIISVLSTGDNFSANDICDRLDLDKASASRSVKVLDEQSFISIKTDLDDNRRRILSMSPKGRRLFDKMLKIALKRQEHLLSGFSPAETALLLEMLKRLTQNAEIVDDFDYAVLVNND